LWHFEPGYLRRQQEEGYLACMKVCRDGFLFWSSGFKEDVELKAAEVVFEEAKEAALGIASLVLVLVAEPILIWVL
jgi:hypothetical protein